MAVPPRILILGARDADELTEVLFANEMSHDVASAIEWLLGTEWVTGQVLGVDGGLARLRTRARAQVPPDPTLPNHPRLG